MDIKITLFVLIGFTFSCYTCGNELNAVKSSNKRFIDTPDIDFEQEFIKLKAEFEAFKNSTQVLLSSQRSGSTFTRWGKSDCPHIVDFVYRGYIAGRKYNEEGGPSDSQCLPSDPTWGRYNDSHTYYHSMMYGTEVDVWPTDNVFDKNVLNEDLPCVVCRTSYPTTITVPARVNCYPGWTQQYMGYLVTNMVGSGRASYESICLDRNPDFLTHSEGNDNQHVVYLMEAKCGSLPCPPYVDNRELACVVCSK